MTRGMRHRATTRVMNPDDEERLAVNNSILLNALTEEQDEDDVTVFGEQDAMINFTALPTPDTSGHRGQSRSRILQALLTEYVHTDDVPEGRTAPSRRELHRATIRSRHESTSNTNPRACKTVMVRKKDWCGLRVPNIKKNSLREVLVNTPHLLRHALLKNGFKFHYDKATEASLSTNTLFAWVGPGIAALYLQASQGSEDEHYSAFGRQLAHAVIEWNNSFVSRFCCS